MKNQLASAELTFNYAHYPELLMLNCTFKARDLLLKLWKDECQCIESKRYVIFLNEKKQFITWKRLPVKIGYGYYYYAREIAGMAVACDASGIVLSHHRLTASKPNRADKDLLTKTIESCKRISVDVLDYLIVTPNELSYKASFMID